MLNGFLAALTLLAAGGFCGDLFPTVAAENLNGKKVELPSLARGKVAVLIIGFTHASQNQTKPWGQRIGHDLEAYPIAVLQDVPKLFRGMAIGGIKSGVPAEMRDRFLLVLSGEQELKKAAGFERADDAYLVLLDANGEIRWRFHGGYTAEALADLKGRAAALADSH